MNIFSKNLRRLMAAKNLNQSDLAGLLGIKQPSVSDWLKNGAIPKGKRLTQLAEILGVSVNELFIEEAIQKASEEQSKDDRIRELEQQLLKTTQELLKYKSQENEQLKNNPATPRG